MYSSWFRAGKPRGFPLASVHHAVYEAPVRMHVIPAALAVLSLALTLWQWLVARRFPLHRRVGAPDAPAGPAPGVTLLKPVKGCEPDTEACLRSWLTQKYNGRVQVLFGVGAAGDPVCDVVRLLLAGYPNADARLVICDSIGGANAKVCTLAALEAQAVHDIIVVSDADVWAPPDLLANAVTLLKTPGVGLVSCFYRLANPTTPAMRWEATAINADFWSQVLQSQSLRPLDFALGAVMVTGRRELGEIGGFRALLDCLADDYELGHRIARRGHRIALSTVVVECWSAPMGWGEVWRHQLRWARTIRVCMPVSYFFSILGNATLWPLVWLAAQPSVRVLACVLACALVRLFTGTHLQRRLAGAGAAEAEQGWESPDLPESKRGGLRAWGQQPQQRQGSDKLRSPVPGSDDEAAATGPAGRDTDALRESQMRPHGFRWRDAWLVWLKDLVQVAMWALAFAGNCIEWRGQRMRLLRDGTLVKVNEGN